MFPILQLYLLFALEYLLENLGDMNLLWIHRSLINKP